MLNHKLAGVIAPILTPFNDDLGFNAELYLQHARWLLRQGIHFIAPFGTTGEAPSLSVDERMQALDVLIDGGIDPTRLMPGTGLCNLHDTKKLCLHAVGRGCAAVMTLPPFFFKNAADEGLYAWFSRLIEEIDHPALKICLYHIPSLAGIGFTPSLVARLATDFPQTVVACKDSSGDFANTEAVIAAAPDLAVFPGSETFLRPGLENGATGCISATCNVNPSGIRKVFDRVAGAVDAGTDRAEAEMKDIRRLIESYTPIPAMKGLLAVKRKDERWRNVRPPLLPPSDEKTSNLIAELAGRLPELQEITK